MHPQIVRDAPGNCPICGMTLEPRAISADKQDNPELRDMTRRFWVSLGLALPVLVSAMSGGLLRQFAPARFWTWFELILPLRWSCGAAGRSLSARGSRS